MNDRHSHRIGARVGRGPALRKTLAALACAVVCSVGLPARADPADGGEVDQLITDMALGMLGSIAWGGATLGSLVFTGVNAGLAAGGTPDWGLETAGYALGGVSIIGGALMIAYQPDDCDASCRDLFVIGGGIAVGLGIASLAAAIVSTATRLGAERPAEAAFPFDLGVGGGPGSAGLSLAIPW
jgi:hypothetical protein